MKYIFVSLTACLSLMILTKSRPVMEKDLEFDECTVNCFKRYFDDFCRLIQGKCDYQKLKCKLQNTPWRQWHYVADKSECIHAKRPNQVVICKSACPVTNCYSTEPACGVNTLSSNCFLFKNLCALKRQACKNTAISHADPARCTNAGLLQPGDTGKC